MFVVPVVPVDKIQLAVKLKIKKIVLKVGSFSFACIIILLVYFLNCRKALFTRRVKVLD